MVAALEDELWALPWQVSTCGLAMEDEHVLRCQLATACTAASVAPSLLRHAAKQSMQDILSGLFGVTLGTP